VHVFNISLYNLQKATGVKNFKNCLSENDVFTLTFVDLCAPLNFHFNNEKNVHVYHIISISLEMCFTFNVYARL